MKPPELEVQIKFDRSLLTEERFAFRKWLEGFIKFSNLQEVSDAQKWFAENFEAFGFKDTRQDREDFVKYFETAKKKGLFRWMKFINLSVKKKLDVYNIRGGVEGYSNEMLVLEGELEMHAMSLASDVAGDENDNKFVFTFFTLSPRMRVSF